MFIRRGEKEETLKINQSHQVKVRKFRNLCWECLLFSDHCSWRAGCLVPLQNYTLTTNVAQMPTNMSKLRRSISHAEHLLLRFARAWLLACSVRGGKGSCCLLETSVINEVLSFPASLYWLYREVSSDSRWSESLQCYECTLLRGRSNTTASDIDVQVNLKESCALKPLQFYLYEVCIYTGVLRKTKVSQREA